MTTLNVAKFFTAAKDLDATAGGAIQMAANILIRGSALCPRANLGNNAAKRTTHMMVANPKKR